MHKFFRHKKTGKIITSDEYENKALENVETNTLDMAETGMDLDTDVFGVQGDYEPYDLESDGDTDVPKD